jgi:FMN-dependent NADH-azoreductase
MSTILHINSSPLYGRSVSRQLTDLQAVKTHAQAI